MIFLPRTTPRIYVSSILALNINSPEHTGDWHSSMYWEHPENSKIDLWIFGDGQKFNTNHLLGELGIIDGTSRLNKMGYYPENIPVWVADHPRAFADILYVSVLELGKLETITMDEWFPSIEDKTRVYDILDIMEPRLDKDRFEVLQQWKRMNPIVEGSYLIRSVPIKN